VNADGSDQVNLTHSTIGDEVPAWSPTGTQIAFSKDRGNPGHSEI